jgi:hypothetical protein
MKRLSERVIDETREFIALGEGAAALPILARPSS